MYYNLLFLALVIYGVFFAFLWGWSLIHAYTTPKIAFSRRGLWTLAIIINPLASMWYWYIWKRWAFWAIFGPVILFSAFLPFALEGLIRTFIARDIAVRFVNISTTILEDIITAIPLPILIPLVVFPFILRLATLAHLGGSKDLDASDRNDYAVAFALPLFGYGAAMAYAFKWRRGWTLAGLCWFLLASGVVWSFVRYI